MRYCNLHDGMSAGSSGARLPSYLFSQTDTPASFVRMYAGRFRWSSGSAGSLTYSSVDTCQGVRPLEARTFIMYDCGAITLDTNGRRANPYCAAPRRVAVSQSGGREITLIRDENCACDGKVGR